MDVDDLEKRVQETIKQKAFIRFINLTCFNIQVIYIVADEDKTEENVYATLCPNQCVDANSYSTHSWIFRECMSNVQMVVEGKKVFIPTTWGIEHARLPFEHPITEPLRKLIKIHSPVLDLQQLCLLKVASTRNITKDDVMRFEIPTMLQTELIQMILKKPKARF